MVDDGQSLYHSDAKTQPLFTFKLQHGCASRLVHLADDDGYESRWVAAGLNVVQSDRNVTRSIYELPRIGQKLSERLTNGGILVTVCDHLDAALCKASDDLSAEVIPQVGVELDWKVRQRDALVRIVPTGNVVDHDLLD